MNNKVEIRLIKTQIFANRSNLLFLLFTSNEITKITFRMQTVVVNINY